MTVGIVTPWFNHVELWPDYRAVINAAQADEVWIIDNGSRPPLDFATLTLPENKGFCGGCNAGLHAATTEVVVFLNNDVALTSNEWLDELIDPLDYGVLTGARIRRDQHTMVDGKVIPYLDGWCLAGYREELLEIGGWDETLVEPAYYSDNLLCLEARPHGLRLVEANVGLTHKLNGSLDPGGMAKVRAATDANHARYVTRARELMSVPA